MTIAVNGNRTGDLFELQIAVSDTGPGIGEDKLLAIFEPFVQEKAAIASTFGGTGLGLSIARSLVEAMGGNIAAENNPGGGACLTVRLSLPCLAAVTSPETEGLTHPVQTDARVVVVEDDHWNAVLLEEILRPRVKTVQVFSAAREAFEFIKDPRNETDLVFTDINMPELGGEAFMDMMKEEGMTIPVIAVTAHIQSEKFERLLRKGFDRVCKKPFRITDIENILDDHFSSGLKTAVEEVVPIAAEEKTNPADEIAFDFSAIRAFAGQDEGLFAMLVQELVNNNTRQVLLFGEHLRLMEAKKLVDLSHQMKTAYDTLKLYGVSESLESLELHGRLGNTQTVLEIAREIYPELARTISALTKVVRHQFHTV